MPPRDLPCNCEDVATATVATSATRTPKDSKCSNNSKWSSSKRKDFKTSEQHPLPIADPTEPCPAYDSQAKRREVLSMLAENTGITYAITSDDETDSEYVIITLTIRGQATCVSPEAGKTKHKRKICHPLMLCALAEPRDSLGVTWKEKNNGCEYGIGVKKHLHIRPVFALENGRKCLLPVLPPVPKESNQQVPKAGK
jgi:hypothetical protein